MTTLRQCSRCKSKLELAYFEKNRQGEYYKCCNNCLSKNRDGNFKFRMAHRNEIIICDKCGEQAKRYNITTHKQRFQCKVFGLEPRPTFNEWLLEQDENELVSEYKIKLKQLKDNYNNDICKK